MPFHDICFRNFTKFSNGLNDFFFKTFNKLKYYTLVLCTTPRCLTTGKAAGVRTVGTTFTRIVNHRKINNNKQNVKIIVIYEINSLLDVYPFILILDDILNSACNIIICDYYQ